jgi:1,2-diacylglycerol 3-alpha-glucosyltransferase
MAELSAADLSIIIPTRRRLETLQVTLAALRAQTEQAFETIVVADGADSRLPELPDVRVVEQEHAGPGAARNRGVRASERPLILFIGDDMVPRPDFVRHHLDRHRSEPGEEVAVLGRVVWHPSVPRNRLHRWLDWSGALFDYRRLEATGDSEAGWTRFYSSNVSLKRELFLAAGGFDPDFVFDYEDLDFGWRLGQHGMRLVYEPAAVTQHLHPYDWAGVKRRYESRAGAERLMMAKHDWFEPWFRGQMQEAVREPPASGLWTLAVDRIPQRATGLRRKVERRAERHYRQRLAPAFLAAWAAASDHGDAPGESSPQAEPPVRTDRAPTVMLACPGLDHAHRGFETFARECFEALRDREDLAITLVKGSGAGGRGELVVPTLTRQTRLARMLARPWSRPSFIVEHVVFGLALIPVVLRRRPDVVYFSEWHLGRVLAAWRRLSRQSFALVFCNGALAPGGYERFDRVQQLVPGATEYSVARGESPAGQELLPLGVAMESVPRTPSDTDRANLRARLGLPADRQIVLSVGAINRQKRVDYLIEEIASMPERRPYLLLVGQEEAETPAIRRLARERLGAEDHDIRTVPPTSMADHYRASDVFVLASLWESFGRVLVEAQSHGLPCLAHEYPVMSWVLGDEGDTADLQESGRLAAWLAGLTAADFSDDVRERRHRSAYERFSWTRLADRYVELLRAAARERRSATGIRS